MDNTAISPFLFEEYAYKWLETALDCGITENAYWDMTLAEAIRAVESRKRVMKAEAQQKASFDYILADLVGRSISRIHSSSNKMPPLYAVYPSLFDAEILEEQQQQKKDELSAMRFRQFAKAYNKGVKNSE